MSTIESILGKPLSEVSQEELQAFVQTRRRDITAIQESDALNSTTAGRRSGTTIKPALKAAIEDAL